MLHPVGVGWESTWIHAREIAGTGSCGPGLQDQVWKAGGFGGLSLNCHWTLPLPRPDLPHTHTRPTAAPFPPAI